MISMMRGGGVLSCCDLGIYVLLGSRLTRVGDHVYVGEVVARTRSSRASPHHCDMSHHILLRED